MSTLTSSDRETRAALQTAYRLLTEAVDRGVEIILDPGRQRTDPQVLRVRARAMALDPALREEIASHWEEVVALLGRYDDFLPEVRNWPEAVKTLLELMEIPNGGRLPRRFVEEVRRMRLVWDLKPWHRPRSHVSGEPVMAPVAETFDQEGAQR